MNDSLKTSTNDLTEDELASLYFISGYISFKEGIISRDTCTCISELYHEES